MVLVDTSIWIEHFRKGNTRLKDLLEKGEVVSHEFIIGELACGNLKNRGEILSLLSMLPKTIIAGHKEVLQFIETHQLMGSGLGLIDVHLLASTLLSDMKLWTLDHSLENIALKLDISLIT
jgi:predicted nucleic acid-binding protein